ncbi:MAG: hypothetical protein HRT68_10345 [Flavobacteriaceae bacterium]|nr:hypothetical protein [Flavobacteriaceae bacterium]
MKTQMKLIIVLILSFTFLTGYSQDDASSFKPIPGETYIISGWVSENHTEPQMNFSSYIEVTFKDAAGVDIPLQGNFNFSPSGDIIDNWQLIKGEFTIPENAGSISIGLVNASTFDSGGQGGLDNGPVAFFDDIRLYPFNGNLKSFVYDPINQRLIAELDENNYATFYDYDDEGGLVRVKKETEDGVYTIQETRSGNSKLNADNND